MSTITSTRVGSTGGSGVDPVQPASSPKVYNVAIANANTEVSQALTANTKKVTIRVRGYSKLQLGFAPTESGTNYITIPRGNSGGWDMLDFSGTLYFQTDKDAQVVEILEWS